jgi:16S rRNA (guanine527-N7)-methyltransferase
MSGNNLSARSEDLLLQYLEQLLHVNETLNLTRITDPAQAERLHLIDSLAAEGELAASPAGSVLDLGSGGGFPGVPLAIVSGRDFVLLDSVGKKARAVAGILAGKDFASLRIDSIAARAEEYARDHRAGYSAVVARAVAPLPSLVELASPLLRVGGRLICLKGCPEVSERASGACAARLAGMREVSYREFVLPEGNEMRTVIAYERAGASRTSLPRRTGLAQHDPLG